MSVPRVFPPSTSYPLPPLLLLLLAIGTAGGQTTPPGDTSGASTPSKTQKVADLTGRYRFSERYTTVETATGPGVVASYRVAIREVIRDSVDSAQGAPRRTESTRQAIYAERPVEMAGGVGMVSSTARLVEKYQARPEDAPRSMGTRPLEGATVFLRPRIGELPLVINLAENRPLTGYEYDTLSHQVYVPHLTALLPAQVVRLGDTWRVPRKGTQALLGDPSVQGDTLVGKLNEIRREVDGPRMVASITITGKVAGAVGETTVNAELLFTFQPPAAIPRDRSKKSTFPPRPAEDMIEARGAITELRMAGVASGPLPGPGRLRFQSNRELTMHRQLGVVPGTTAPPALDKAPEPTEANTWLTHADPSGRYSLRHPQDMLPPDRSQPAAEPNTTLLIRMRRERRDMVHVEYSPKTLAPADLKKKLAEKYGMLKMDVLKGEEEWLPEVDWPGLRVHRIDAALQVSDPKAAGPAKATRIHFDGYLIQFAQAPSILVIATTSRESVVPFRQEVEQILKTIQLDPARPSASHFGEKQNLTLDFLSPPKLTTPR